MVNSEPLVPIDRFEVFAEGLDHPEGLAFDADGNLWAGGELGQIYRINPNGKVRTVTTVGGFNLGLTFSARQQLYVCNFKLGAVLQLDRSGKILRTWERTGRYRLRNPNFSVFDREGNLYFSDSGAWRKEDGFLFVLRPNGKIEELLRGLSFPNGLSLSTDERTLYVVQTTRDNVLAVPIVSPQKSASLACTRTRCTAFPTARSSTQTETSTSPATPRTMSIVSRPTETSSCSLPIATPPCSPARPMPPSEATASTSFISQISADGIFVACPPA